MSIGALSSSTSTNPPTSLQNTMKQNFQALTQAIQSGNVTAAQQAYATLTQNMPGQGASSNGQADPFQQAIASIGSALQSGDISGAQTAMQNLTQTMKAHHGHHHHGTQNQSTDQASSTSTAAATPAANSLLDVSA